MVSTIGTSFLGLTVGALVATITNTMRSVRGSTIVCWPPCTVEIARLSNVRRVKSSPFKISVNSLERHGCSLAATSWTSGRKLGLGFLRYSCARAPQTSIGKSVARKAAGSRVRTTSGHGAMDDRSRAWCGCFGCSSLRQSNLAALLWRRLGADTE